MQAHATKRVVVYGGANAGGLGPFPDLSGLTQAKKSGIAYYFAFAFAWQDSNNLGNFYWWTSNVKFATREYNLTLMAPQVR